MLTRRFKLFWSVMGIVVPGITISVDGVRLENVPTAPVHTESLSIVTKVDRHTSLYLFLQPTESEFLEVLRLKAAFQSASENNDPLAPPVRIGNESTNAAEIETWLIPLSEEHYGASINISNTVVDAPDLTEYQPGERCVTPFDHSPVRCIWIKTVPLVGELASQRMSRPSNQEYLPLTEARVSSTSPHSFNIHFRSTELGYAPDEIECVLYLDGIQAADTSKYTLLVSFNDIFLTGRRVHSTSNVPTQINIRPPRGLIRLENHIQVEWRNDGPAESDRTDHPRFKLLPESKLMVLSRIKHPVPTFDVYCPTRFLSPQLYLTTSPSPEELKMSIAIISWLQHLSREIPVTPTVHFQDFSSATGWPELSSSEGVILISSAQRLSEAPCEKSLELPIHPHRSFQLLYRSDESLACELNPDQSHALMQVGRLGSHPFLCITHGGAASQNSLAKLAQHLTTPPWSGEGNILLLGPNERLFIMDTAHRLATVSYPEQPPMLEHIWIQYRTPLTLFAWLVLTGILVGVYFKTTLLKEAQL